MEFPVFFVLFPKPSKKIFFSLKHFQALAPFFIEILLEFEMFYS